MSSSDSNPLLSTQKSDSDIHAILHPLVLLTVSDYITRHTLREQTCPLAGGILGQQNGREITMEHAFECATSTSDDGDMQLNHDWFTQRLDQMKLVHKDRGLDLVGWFTVLPRTGPTQSMLKLHNQILEFNESAALLAFHPEEVATASGGKLPISIYETVYESDEARRDGAGDGSRQKQAEAGEDKEMKDGEEEPLKLRFRELASYSVETGEAEMISIDFVARGAANASATASSDQQKRPKTPPQKTIAAPVKADVKGKRRAISKEVSSVSNAGVAEGPAALSREDEDLIATLSTKANAIRMLHARIQLITKYLEGLPSQDLPASEAKEGAQPTTPSPTVLRSIQALVNRIPLLVPASTDVFQEEMLSEANDVNLISLLTDVLQSANELRDLGKKHAIIEQSKTKRPSEGFQGMSTGPRELGFGLNVGDLLT